MKKLTLLFIAFGLLLSNSLFAHSFYTVADGKWDDPNTWNNDNPTSIPGPLDDVVIKGFSVEIDLTVGDVSVNSIVITNEVPPGHAELIMDGAITLTVASFFTSTLGAVDQGIEVRLLNGAILDVGSDLSFSRLGVNSYSQKLLLNVQDTSRVKVRGNFSFSYTNAQGPEEENEIYLIDKAVLEVTGNTNLNLEDGNNFSMVTLDSAEVILKDGLSVTKSGGNEMSISIGYILDLTGDANIMNTGGDNGFSLSASNSKSNIGISGNLFLNASSDERITINGVAGGSNISVGGDISMTALSQEDIEIDIKSGSNLSIGGNFYRVHNFGALLMASDATLTYNGTTKQTLAAQNLDGSGSDVFSFGIVQLENAVGYDLQDTFFVENDMMLSKGVIDVYANTPIIIADQVNISGGSESAYVNGPLVKRGRSTDKFTFPIGNSSTYAPLEVSKLNNANTEYTALYKGDPPPFGAFEKGITTISDNEHWELKQKADVEDVFVTLHWDDAQASGINDLDSLIVVGLSSDGSSWINYGMSSITGSTGAGQSGSVTQRLDGDPPPFGVFKFTIGSTDIINPLPAELSRFNAVKQNSQVYLSWETEMEVNVDEYLVEKSNDGLRFEPLTSVKSRGNSSSRQVYSAYDVSAFYGVNYYRLKIVDRDGSFEYSNMESVTFELIPFMEVVPNPVRDVLKIVGPVAGSDSGTLEIFDRSGSRVYLGTFSFENGLFQISTAEINALSLGIYYIKITGRSESRTMKFLKTN